MNGFLFIEVCSYILSLTYQFRCSFKGITKQYGSAVRISTILTNAPLNTDEPVNTSECKDCMICTKACPGEAVKGSNWSIKSSREEYFDPVKCRRSAREISKELLDKEISLYGKCIYICPYTQNYIK